MMKRFSVLSLVVSCAMIFSMTVFGCKKAEQQAEAPKSAEQGQAPAAEPVKGFSVTNGTLERGGLGYILSAEKDKIAVAAKPTGKPYKSVITVRARIKSALPDGTRNGYILFAEKPGQWTNAGILIGGMKYVIEGPSVSRAELPVKFDQDHVFDGEMVVNLKEKTVIWKVNGSEVKTKLTKVPGSINYVGYAVGNAKTEFSELQVSGD
ncbi:MAG: hypothetical protein WAV13_01470 [Thermodesulfovibrionales bacterium]